MTPLADTATRAMWPGSCMMPNGIAEILDLARSLTPSQRQAFILRDLFGYSTGEAADLLGSSEVAIRVHLHAARRRLRKAVEEA